MSEKYDEYLTTDYWKAVTQAVKQRAGYRCQVCNSQHDLQSHHRTYDHRGRELEHLGDLICLCRRCHGIFHGIAQSEPKQTKYEDRQAKKAAFRAERAKLRYQLRRSGINHDEIVRDMPVGEEIVLTRELIERLRTKAGAFTNASLRPLGLRSPLISGWAKRLEGMKVNRATYQTCLEGRYIYNSGKLPRVALEPA